MYYVFYFSKINNEKSSDYLFQSIPRKKLSYTTRNDGNISFFKLHHTIFWSTIIEWYKLALDLGNSASYSAFKKIF